MQFLYLIILERKTNSSEDMVEEKKSITEQEDQMLIKHYDGCHQVGGKVRMEQMLKLIGYLETKEWMK